MKILMPQIGMTMVEGTIEVWEKKDGDTVNKGDVLVQFSTEKMTSVVEAPVSGVLKILAQEGEIIACGDPIAEIV